LENTSEPRSHHRYGSLAMTNASQSAQKLAAQSMKKYEDIFYNKLQNEDLRKQEKAKIENFEYMYSVKSRESGSGSFDNSVNDKSQKLSAIVAAYRSTTHKGSPYLKKAGS
jgi:hypothetical protein